MFKTKSFDPIARILALFLSLVLALPNPVFALRIEQKEDKGGLEEIHLALKGSFDGWEWFRTVFLPRWNSSFPRAEGEPGTQPMYGRELLQWIEELKVLDPRFLCPSQIEPEEKVQLIHLGDLFQAVVSQLMVPHELYVGIAPTQAGGASAFGLRLRRTHPDFRTPAGRPVPVYILLDPMQPPSAANAWAFADFILLSGASLDRMREVMPYRQKVWKQISTPGFLVRVPDPANVEGVKVFLNEWITAVSSGQFQRPEQGVQAYANSLLSEEGVHSDTIAFLETVMKHKLGKGVPSQELATALRMILKEKGELRAFLNQEGGNPDEIFSQAVAILEIEVSLARLLSPLQNISHLYSIFFNPVDPGSERGKAAQWLRPRLVQALMGRQATDEEWRAYFMQQVINNWDGFKKKIAEAAAAIFQREFLSFEERKQLVPEPWGRIPAIQSAAGLEEGIEQFRLPEGFVPDHGIVVLRQEESEDPTAVEGTALLNFAGPAAGLQSALLSYQLGLSALRMRNWTQAVTHVGQTVRLLHGIRDSLTGESDLLNILGVDESVRQWVLNRLKGATSVAVDALAYAVSKQRSAAGLEEELPESVQAVVERILADPHQGGVIVRLGGHEGSGDDKELLDFVDQLLRAGVPADRLLMLREAGPPEPRSFENLLERLDVMDRIRLTMSPPIGRGLYPFAQKRPELLASIRNYYARGGQVPIPLSVMFPDSADAQALTDMYGKLSPLFQEWSESFDRSDDWGLLNQEIRSRGIDLRAEQSPLSSWILYWFCHRLPRQFEQELFAHNNKEAYREGIRTQRDLSCWSSDERDFAIAAQQSQESRALYPTNKLILIAIGHLHGDSLERRLRGSKVVTDQVPFAVSRAEAADPEGRLPLERLSAQRSREGRTGQEFSKSDLELLPKADLFLDLYRILRPDSISDSKTLQIISAGLPDRLSSQIIVELDQATDKLRGDRGWPGGDTLPLELRPLAQAYFVYAFLNQKELIPQGLKPYFQPDVVDMTLADWKQRFKTKYLSSAGLEERFILLDKIKSANSWQDLFGNSHPVAWEIGIDQGDALYERAMASPGVNFLGIDVSFDYFWGWGARSKHSPQEYPPNVRFLRADIYDLVQMLPRRFQMLHAVYIDFPDSPEFRALFDNPRSRLKGRYILESSTLRKLLQFLSEGGEFILRTESERVRADFYDAVTEAGGQRALSIEHSVHHEGIPKSPASRTLEERGVETYLLRYRRSTSATGLEEAHQQDYAKRLQEGFDAAWQRLARLGSLSEIVQQSFEEFARRVPAIPVTSMKAGPLVPVLITVSKEAYPYVLQVRDRWARRREKDSLVYQPPDERYTWEEAAEIQGPGIYMFVNQIELGRERGLLIGKEALFHEIVEEELCKVNIKDPRIPNNHRDLSVIVSGLQFAALLGEEEFLGAVHWRHKELKALNNQQYSDLLQPILSKPYHVYRQEAQVIWNRVRLDAAGLEEGQAAFAAAREFVDGFESMSPPDSRVVVIVGQELAQRFLGLQVYAGLEERVIIDRGNPVDTILRAASRGDAVHFYGGLEEANELRPIADKAQMGFTAEDPASWNFSTIVARMLSTLGFPSRMITAGLEEFTRDLRTVGEAA